MSKVPSQIRQQVFEEDDYHCQLCGAKGGKSGDEDLDAHHVVSEKEGGKTTISNLVTLCRKHHTRYHCCKLPISDLSSVDSSKYSIDLSEADRDIIGTLKQNGSSRICEITESVGVSREHCRRLRVLMAENIVNRWYDSNRWDLSLSVEESAGGKWLKKSNRAGRIGGYEGMRPFWESGYLREEIVDAIGIHPSTVCVGINEARALEPSLYKKNGSTEVDKCTSFGVNAGEDMIQTHGDLVESGSSSEPTDREEIRATPDQLKEVYQVLAQTTNGESVRQ